MAPKNAVGLTGHQEAAEESALGMLLLGPIRLVIVFPGSPSN